MVKRTFLAFLTLATLTTCGLFLPDDFPAWLPFVEAEMDLKGEMDNLGYSEFDVLAGWMPLPRYDKDWVFVHMDVPYTGGKHIGVIALDRSSLGYQGWKENIDPSHTQSPFLYESVNGWASGNTEWAVNNGILQIQDVVSPELKQNGPVFSYNAPLGTLNYVHSAQYSMPNTINFVSVTDKYSNWSGGTSRNGQSTSLSFTRDQGTIKQAANLSDGRVAILVAGFGGTGTAVGQVGFYTSASSVYLVGNASPAPFTSTYSGFPVYKTDGEGGVWITTDGPVVYDRNDNEKKIIRYKPENGATEADSITLPDGFIPLGFSVEDRQWLAYDENSGKLYRLRAWW